MSETEYSYETETSYDGGSSGNEADSEEEDYGKKYRKLTELMKEFNPYMYEPEKDVSSTSSSEVELDADNVDNNDIDGNSRVGSLEWCTCGQCILEKRDIDCLCCQEVAALNEFFDKENVGCITENSEFKTLCLN